MEMKKKGGHEGKNGVDVEMEIEGPNDINFAIAHGCNHNICSPNRSTVNHRWSAFNSLQFTLARMLHRGKRRLLYCRACDQQQVKPSNYGISPPDIPMHLVWNLLLHWRRDAHNVLSGRRFLYQKTIWSCLETLAWKTSKPRFCVSSVVWPSRHLRTEVASIHAPGVSALKMEVWCM